nr:acyl-CoA dehydrogenase family protein [Nannocystis pusilla]
MTGVPYILSIDHLLTDEERLTWQAARDFGTKRIAPVIEQHYERGTFPRELIPEFAAMGFLGAPLHGYGCAGMNPVAYGLTMIELERQDSGIRSFCSVQSALAMWPIFAYGDEAQRERWLPGMARGEIIGAFGLTEPNSGSDPGSMRTHARQQEAGGDYVLTGQKMWITNSPIADVLVVWAKTLDFGSDTPVIRGFLVERGMAGLQTPETHGKLSLRASITGEIVLDEVRVPAANLLPGVRGLKGPLGCLTQARYGIGWGAVGAAMSVYERARDYTLQRTHSGGRSPASSSPSRSSSSCTTTSARASCSPTTSAGSSRTASSPPSRSRTSSGTTCAWPWSQPAPRARCSAATASWASFTSCGTCATSRRSTPTRAPTRSTLWRSVAP